MRDLKHQWKCQFRGRQALNRLSFHKARGWIYSLKSVSREVALETHGWVATRAKNRMLLWVDDKLGRLEWFVTGRVNVWLKKPASFARGKQLLANAFFATGLVKDIQVFDLWANTLRFKGAHLVYDTGEHLPYARIDYLKESMGVVVKLGDVTHPTSVEIEFCYPDFAEKNEVALQQMTRAFQQFAQAFQGLSSPQQPERLEKASASYIQ